LLKSIAQRIKKDLILWSQSIEHRAENVCEQLGEVVEGQQRRLLRLVIWGHLGYNFDEDALEDGESGFPGDAALLF
jgi:hypothetical protein